MFDTDYADPDLELTEEMSAVWIEDEPYEKKLPDFLESKICKRAVKIFKSRELTIRAVMKQAASNN